MSIKVVDRFGAFIADVGYIRVQGATRLEGDPSVAGKVLVLDEIPTGVILMWAGDPDDLPEGWQICDSTNGTPDLRDKFIVSSGEIHEVGISEHILSASDNPPGGLADDHGVYVLAFIQQISPMLRITNPGVF